MKGDGKAVKFQEIGGEKAVKRLGKAVERQQKCTCPSKSAASACGEAAIHDS